jgi:hypothetical protein
VLVNISPKNRNFDITSLGRQLPAHRNYHKKEEKTRKTFHQLFESDKYILFQHVPQIKIRHWPSTKKQPWQSA